MASSSVVSILLLGSGWTSQFVIPALKAASISFAYTRRAPISSDVGAIPFEAVREGQQKAAAFQALPQAEMVVVIFPLTSAEFIQDIVTTYEEAKQCQPAWLGLGSTSAWSKGVSTSSTPILKTNARAVSEEGLLSMHTSSRSTAVLNLSGLYGGKRNPANFAKKVGETMEKLEEKTSLHLVHGKDVAQAIIGMWDALQDPKRKESTWGKRWIVTGKALSFSPLVCAVLTTLALRCFRYHVYDWWQLFTTLQPAPHAQGKDWVKQLTSKHSIDSLPRPLIGQGGDRDVAPYVLDRALDGKAFWTAVGRKPLVGRCDDYSPGGGGKELQDGEQSKEAL